MLKEITSTHIQSVWNHSDPLEVPYSANLQLVRIFFAVSYSKPALIIKKGAAILTIVQFLFT